MFHVLTRSCPKDKIRLSDRPNFFPFKVALEVQTCPVAYELIYQLDAIEYLFVYFQLDMFRAYTPIFRSNGCYSFFTYAAYGVFGVVRCRSWVVCVLVACRTATRHQHTHSSGPTPNYTKDTIRCICKEFITSIAPEDGRVSPKHFELKEHK
jgi:hypothetical protein